MAPDSHPKFKSYLLVEGRTMPLTSALVKKFSPTSGGRMNQATQECLRQNPKSSYLRVDERTKSLTSALDKIPCLPTYGWSDDPSHS